MEIQERLPSGKWSTVETVGRESAPRGKRSHATKAAKEIVGFEFLIKDDGKSYWTRLQGSGGQFGAGSLHAVHNLGPKTPRVQALCSKLLSQAREELRREGTIRSYRDHEDPARRIRPVAASAILKCRPIVAEGRDDKCRCDANYTVNLNQCALCGKRKS
jgi:hypothetical protein